MGKLATRIDVTEVIEGTDDEGNDYRVYIHDHVPDFDGLCRPPEMPIGKTNTDS